MPELPEVERFRQILLPMVDEKRRNPPISFELHGEKPPRKWVAAEDVDSNTGKWRCTDVLRKGKQLCMVLEKDVNCRGKKKKTTTESKEVCYFYLHMGMTGRLVSPTMPCTWGHKYVSDSPDAGEEAKWPPRFTYLVLTSGATTVAFADPRKFGACHFEFDGGDGGSSSPSPSPSLFDGLAPDALADTATPEQRSAMASAIAGQRLGVKALILDQKRVVSGVGNWVADEVLYGCELHPDQSHLTEEQALAVVVALRSVVSIAVDCLDRGVPYPDEWLFGYRWTKKKAGKDHAGRSLSFVTSGGRTSAIVAPLQKLRKTNKKAAAVAAGKKTKAKSRGKATKAMKAAASPEVEKVATADATGDEEVNSVASRKRKTAGSEAVRQGVGKRKRSGPSSSASTATATSSNFRRRSGRGNTSDTDSAPNAAAAPDEVRSRPSESLSGEEDKIKSDDKQQHKKKTVKKERQAGKQKKEGSTTTPLSKREKVEDEESAEALFHREKGATLEGVDKSVKDDFRRVGFAKWQKGWLPVIQLGPYDVSAGPVRDSWMKLVRNTKKKKNGRQPQPTAKRLVYWYGSNRDDLSASFSFVNGRSVISYEEGVEQGVCDGISSKIRKKTERNARLTAKEKLLMQGLAEVRDESALPRRERLAWLRVGEAQK